VGCNSGSCDCGCGAGTVIIGDISGSYTTLRIECNGKKKNLFMFNTVLSQPMNFNSISHDLKLRDFPARNFRTVNYAMKIYLNVAFIVHSFFSLRCVLFGQVIFNLQQRVNPGSCKAEMMFVGIVTTY
jgi:hypothetical protein